MPGDEPNPEFERMIDNVFQDIRDTNLAPDLYSYKAKLVRLRAYAYFCSLHRIFTLLARLRTSTERKSTRTPYCLPCKLFFFHIYSLLDEMREADIKPDAAVYNRIIQAYAERGHLPQAHQYLSVRHQLWQENDADAL